MDIQVWWDSLDALTRVLYAIAIPATCALAIQFVLIAIGLGQGGADGVDAGGIDAGGADGAPMDGGSFDLTHGALSGGADSLDAHFDGGTDGGSEAFDFRVDEAHSGWPPYGAEAGASEDGDHAAHESGMDALRLFSLSGIVSFFTVFGWSSIILYRNALPGALSVVVGLALGYGAMFAAAKLVQWSVRLQEDGNLALENALGQVARVYVPIPSAGGGEGKVTLTIQERFVELSALTEAGEGIPSGAPVRVTALRDGALVVERVDEAQA